MKDRYRLVCLGDRNGMFYCKDKALRLISHKNEAAANPQVNRKIGLAYLSASDPDFA